MSSLPPSPHPHPLVLSSCLLLLLSILITTTSASSDTAVPVPLPFHSEYYLGRLDMTSKERELVQTFVKDDKIRYTYHLSESDSTTALQTNGWTFIYKNDGDNCYKSQGNKLWNVLQTWNQDFTHVYSNGSLVSCGKDSLFYQNDTCFVYWHQYTEDESAIMQFWMREDIHPVKIFNLQEERLITVFDEKSQLGEGATTEADFALPISPDSCPEHPNMDALLIPLKKEVFGY